MQTNELGWIPNLARLYLGTIEMFLCSCPQEQSCHVIQFRHKNRFFSEKPQKFIFGPTQHVSNSATLDEKGYCISDHSLLKRGGA